MISFNCKKIQTGLISDKEFAWYFNLKMLRICVAKIK